MATIITSQLPVKSGYENINKATLANAIMDRMTANAKRMKRRIAENDRIN